MSSKRSTHAQASSTRGSVNRRSQLHASSHASIRTSANRRGMSARATSVTSSSASAATSSARGMSRPVSSIERREPIINTPNNPRYEVILEDDQRVSSIDSRQQSLMTDDSSRPEVIMAIHMRNDATVGCAYFNTTDNTLHVSDDIPLADTDIVGQFLIHAQPTTLLVSARAPVQFTEYIEGQANSSFAESGHDSFILRGLQSSEFSFDAAQERIFNLEIHDLGPVTAIYSTPSADSEEQGPIQESTMFKSMRNGASINLNSQLSVGCAGAVLGDLNRRRSAGCLPDGQMAEELFYVGHIMMFSLRQYMLVNADALVSLQIVQTELHPNSQAWGSENNNANSKESLSVYGLFHLLAYTPQGRSQLRQLFLRPVLNVELIRQRQKTISVLLQPDNSDELRRISFILRKISNLRNSIAQLKKGAEFPSAGKSFDKGVWATIRRFAAKTLELREVLGSINGGDELHIVHKLIEGLHVESLVQVGNWINSTIDFDQSKSRHRSSVRAGIDPELDALKRRYDGMESFLSEVVKQMSQELPEWACQYIRSCIFLPQLGFLTVVEPLPGTENGRYTGEGSPGGAWEKLFITDGAVCYKNSYMKDLDEEHGDMYCQIGDREVEIIHTLANRVLGHEKELSLASDLCGEFDALMALALGADKYGWSEPQIVEGSVLQIEGGRHPLQELIVPSFVPNDCNITEEGINKSGIPHQGPNAFVLTGPNHSGKSVYLKQTGLIVYLAHIGSFVPASRATIGLTDKIITRISTRESMSGSESAFAIDLKQIAMTMRCATPRSLVLVDEFGKGTNADDGAGLFTAFLDHFLSLGPSRPRLLVATHFHEAFEGGYLANRRGLCLAHMDVKVDWESTEAEDQVTFLFKLTQGHSTASFGSRCAALNGVPDSVVERAGAIEKFLARNEDLRAVCSHLSDLEEHELEQAEKTARRFLEADFGDTASSSSQSEDRQSMKYTLTKILLSDS